MREIITFLSSRLPPDAGQYRQLVFQGRTLGFVDHRFVARLEPFPTEFATRSETVELIDHGLSYADRSRRLDDVMRDIYRADDLGFGKWCAETTPVVPRFGESPVFDLQRAAVGFLGVLTCGVHLNVYSTVDGRPCMRIARRSAKIASHPGLLDQAVAGFLPVGASPRSKLVEESLEEAGLHQQHLQHALACGSIEFVLDRKPGLQRGAVYVFDLEIPLSAELKNQDGEVDQFLTMPPSTVVDCICNNEFKFDSAVVALDFLLRHGQLDCEHEDFLNLGGFTHGTISLWDERHSK